MTKWVYINQKLIKSSQAKISIQERGFKFGDGAFETIYVENYTLYQFSKHLTRLEETLKLLRIYVNINQIKENAFSLVRNNDLDKGYVRISVSRGIGSYGYMPSEHLISSNNCDISLEDDLMENGNIQRKNSSLVIIETVNSKEYNYSPKYLYLSSYEKISNRSLPTTGKLMQGLSSTLALIEARENNCFESLMLNYKQEICELSSANIFWFKNNYLYTPSLNTGIVAGVLREVIITLSPYEVIEGNFFLEDLKNAEAMFATNSAYQLMPIADIKNYQIISCIDTKRIFNIFYELIRQDIEKFCYAKSKEEI